MSTSIITQAIEWLLDKLKAKNGTVWAIVMAVLAFLYFGLQYITNHPELGVIIPSDIKGYIDGALIILAAITGSHTKASQKAELLNKPTIKSK